MKKQYRRCIAVVFFLLCIQMINAQSETIHIFFDNDSFIIKAEQEKRLIQTLNQIDTSRILDIQISAWCDDKASDSYNQLLSEKRAENTKHMLVHYGLQEMLIVATRGFGEVALNDSETVDKQRSFNRRADIQIRLEAEEKKTVLTEAPVLLQEPVEKPDTQGITDNMQVGDKLLFESILFEGGRAFFLPESYPALDSLAIKLKEHPEYHIIIHGHICCRPNGKDGQDLDTGKRNLSVARAKKVHDYLVEHGINRHRLQYKGHGASFPLGKGDKYDRRVEIEISKIVPRED